MELTHLLSVLVVKKEESLQQLRALRAFLGVSDRPDEQYQKVEGSCEWLEARDDFREWQDRPFEYAALDKSPTRGKTVSVYWVHANPGTGKSVLASHVVNRLQELELECAYHHFHAGGKSSRSLGMFLRSIAYQMAVSNAAVCAKLFALAQDGSSLDMDDSRIIWMKLFKKGIFQVIDHPPPFMWLRNNTDAICQGFHLYAAVLGH